MVRRVAEAVVASQAGPIVAVVGHEADKVRATLDPSVKQEPKSVSSALVGVVSPETMLNPLP